MTANALAAALLDAEGEGESAKDFIRRQGIRRPGDGGVPIIEYETELLGFDNAQYFQGVGVAHTDWDNVYVGTGSNPREALDDAIEGAALDGWAVGRIDTAQVPEQPTLEDYIANLQREQGIDPEEDDGEWDIYYYAAFYVRGTSPIREAEEGKPESAKDYLLRRGHQNYEVPSLFKNVKHWRKARASTFGYENVLSNKSAAGKNNTSFRKYWHYDGFTYAVRLHNTDILTWDKNGSVHVNNGGWRTVTTKDRINSFLPPGWGISQERYQWYWHNSGAWDKRQRVVAPGIFGNNRPNRILFNNGDFIDARGHLHAYNNRLVVSGPFDVISAPVVAAEPVQEGKYQKELDWLLRARKKHDRMREVKRLQKDVEEVDKVQPVGKRPKKRLNIH